MIHNQMSPEPTIISKSSEAEADANSLKIIILALFGMGMSVLTTYVFSRVLSSLSSVGFAIWAGSVMIFSVFVVLQALFIKNRGRLAFIIVLEGLVPLAIIYKYVYPIISVPVAIGLGLGIVCFMVGAFRGWGVLRESLNIKLALVSKAVIPPVVTGVLIFSAMFMYVNYFTAGGFSKDIGRSVVNGLLTTSEPVIHLLSSDVSFKQTPKEFFTTIARTQFEKIPFSEAIKKPEFQDFRNLPEKEKSRMINEVADKLRISVEEKYGYFDDSQTMSDGIFAVLLRWFVTMNEKTAGTLPAIFAIMAFFAIKGVFALFYWLPSLLAFLIYKFLIVTGFAHTSLETRRREFVVLS